MKRTIVVAALLVPFFAAGQARAEDPFAGGGDALAVKDGDGSSSLRAKLKLKKMLPDMVMVQVKGQDDKNFPHCVLVGKVIKDAKKKDKYFKMLARGKTYRFLPVLKKKGGGIDLKHKMTQNNLGACYYPKNSKLVIRVAGVDKKKKGFKASEIYLK